MSNPSRLSVPAKTVNDYFLRGRTLDLEDGQKGTFLEWTSSKKDWAFYITPHGFKNVITRSKLIELHREKLTADEAKKA
jgi:hypothetical protein